MFTTVASNVNDPDATGTRARRAAVECFKLVQDLDLSAFIADTTTFCADVAMGLDAAYSAVLQLGANRLQEAEQFGAADYLRCHQTGSEVRVGCAVRCGWGLQASRGIPE
jgi:hypothetical protein